MSSGRPEVKGGGGGQQKQYRPWCQRRTKAPIRPARCQAWTLDLPMQITQGTTIQPNNGPTQARQNAMQIVMSQIEEQSVNCVSATLHNIKLRSA